MSRVRLIRTIDGNNIFNKTNIFKKTFSYGTFLIAAICSIILLFRMGENISDLESLKNIQIKEYTVYGFYITFLWYSSIRIIYKVKTSIRSQYTSFTIAAILMGYIVWMLFFGVNYSTDEWAKIYIRLKWVIPAWSIFIAWDLLKCILESKIRPFYAKYLFSKLLLTLIFMYISIVAYFSIDTYWVKNKDFDYLDTLTLFNIIFSGLLIIIGMALSYWIAKYLKFVKAEISAGKRLHYSQKLLIVGSIFIWIASTITLKNYSYKHTLFILLSIFILIGITMIALTRKEVGGRSRIYKIVSSFAVFTLTLNTFLFSEYVGGNWNFYSIIWIGSLIYLFTIDAIVSANIISISILAEKLFTFFIIIYSLGIWFISNITGYDLKDVPFDLHLILILIPLIMGGLKTILTCCEIYIITHKISKNAKKLIKLEKTKEALYV